MAHRLLVVDDEKDITEMLSEKLGREGFEVVTALDGIEALEKVRSADPDLIIMDLMMPNLNGFEVLKELKEKPGDKWRPVIILSAKAELDAVKACYELEADHYLTKPCSFDNLMRGIETMISLIPAREAR